MNLFDYSEKHYPHAPGWKERDTSREAAWTSAKKASAIRESVKAWFLAGKTGSGEECAAALGMKMHTVRSRCSELEAAGVLEDSGMRTNSETTGKSAIVWKIKCL